MTIYIVKPQDTLYSIAMQFGVSQRRLIYDNQLADEGRLVPGQALLVLEPEIVHQVVPGDTIISISRKYGMTQKQFLQNNPYLLEQNYLVAGEYVVISYADKPNLQMLVTGYAYPFIETAVLREALLYIDELLVFSYGFTTTGELIAPENADYLINEAKSFDVSPLLVLTPFGADGNFNNYLVNIAVENQEVQTNLINNLLSAVTAKGYDGVDVDFEYILPEDMEGYALFVGRLREVMNARGYKVSVALAPKTSSDQPGLLYEGMDYRLLGESADHVFLMTYEWGYAYGPPMAVAPLNKVIEVLDYAVTEILPDKILMGVPNYGYDWQLPYQRGVTKAAVIGNVEAVQIAADNNAEIQFDEIAYSPYFVYTTAQTVHEVWFEDVRSIQRKIQTAYDYGFWGFGYWNLMKTFRANWLLVHSLILNN